MKKILPFSLPLPRKIKHFFKRVTKLPKGFLAACLIVLVILIGSGITFFLIPYLSNKNVEAAWFNENWSYRQIIAITNAGSAQTDFQISFTLNTSSLITAGKMQAGCQDIRITDFSGKVLPYWIEKGTGATCNTTTTKIWTKIPSISTTGNTIYVYYGNFSALSAESGKDTFLYFDDFNSNANTGLWSVTDPTGTQITFSGGRMNFITGNATWGQAAYMTPSVARGETTFEADFLPATTGNFMFGWKDDGSGVSYANLVYGYFEPNSTTPQVYEDANARGSVSGTWTQGTNYKVRMRMRASGGNYYDQSTDGGINFTNSYTSTYSTESTLHPGFMLYSGTSYIDNFFVRKDATTAPSAAAPASEEKAPTAIGYWKFDEGTGTVARTSTNPGFTPKDMNGLALWLDASAPTSITLATGVTQWRDLSANARNFAQATAGQQPSYVPGILNGKPVVQFAAASSQTMTNSTNFSTPNTVIYVSRQTGGTNARVLSGLADNWLMGYHNTRKQQAYFNGWVLGNGTGPLSDTSWHLFSSTQTGSTASNFYESGTLLASNTNGVAGPNGLSLNGHQAANEFSDAQIAEVIVYNRVLSTEERLKVEAYLAAKWGLGTPTLVTTNPYYSQNGPNGGDGILSNFASPPSVISGWQTEDQCISSKCLRFDGVDDYVTVGDPATGDLDIGSGDFTVGVWIKTTSTTASIDALTKGAAGDFSYSIRVNNAACGGNGGRVAFNLWQAGGTTYQRPCSTTEVNDGKWHYVVGTWTASGTTARVYVDGILEGTTNSGTGTFNNTSAGNLVFGRVGDVSGFYYQGSLDEARIYKYARSADQIKADFNARSNPEGVSQQQGNNIQNLPAALSNGLSGYWDMDQSASPSTDGSGNSNSATWAGNTASTTGKFSLGNTFDGNDDYMTAADSTSLDVTQVTMSAWINPTALGGVIMTKAIGAAGTGGYYMDTSGSKIRFCATGGCVSSTTTIPTSTWSHVTATWDGTTVRFYLNGALDGTSTGTVTSVATNAAVLVFAMDSSGTTDYNGRIDEARIYNRALSDDEVNLLYNWAPGPVGYWDFEENPSTATAYDRSGYSNNGSWTGTAGVSGPGKYGKAGIFNGSSNYVSIPAAANSSLDIVNTVTIEAWVKPNSATQDARIFSRGQYAVRGFGLVQAGTQFNLGQNGGSNFSAGPTITAGKWYHVVGVVNNTASQLWVNGVMVGTGTVNIGGTSTSDPAQIGAEITSGAVIQRYFNGSIDEVKIYNYPRSASQIVEDYNAGHPSPGSPVGSSILNYKFNEGFGKLTQNSVNNQDTVTGLAAYWNFNESSGTAADSSPNGFTATLGGTNTYVTGKYGNAVNNAAGGVGTTVSYAAGSALDMTTASRPTISFWYKSSTGSQTTRFIEAVASGGWGLEIISGDLRINTVSGSQASFSHTMPSDGVWYHYVVTYDGTNANLYRNGNLVTSVAYSPTWSSGAKTLSILGDASFPTNATIDDLRIYNRNLTLAQISTLYNRGPEGTLLNISNPATSTSGWTTAGKLGKAINFGGNGDKVQDWSLPDDFFTNSWTQTFWIKSTQNNTNSVLTEKGSNIAFIQTNSGQIRAGTTSAGGSFFDTTGSPTVTDGNWHHVAVTYDGGTNLLTSYIDGLNRGSLTTANDATSDATPYQIGSRGTSSTFIGTLDEVKVYDSALTAEQVKLEVNQGSAQVLGTLSSSQTVPTAGSSEYCIPGDSSTCTSPVLEWKLEEGSGTTVQDSSGGANTGTAINSPIYIPGKIGKGLNFSGTSYVTAAETTSTDFGDNDFTISLWVKGTTVADGLVASKHTVGGATGWMIRSNVVANKISFYTNNAYLSTTSSFNDNNWHHIVATYTASNNERKIYFDGRLEGTDTASDAQANNAGNAIGCVSVGSFCFTGSVDQLRIYNYVRTGSQVAWEYNQGKPRAYLKLDDCQGTTINDSSGNSFTGTLTATSTVGTCSTASTFWGGAGGTGAGKRNYAPTFNGTGDYITLANPTLLPANNAPQTLSAWFNYPTTPVSTATILSLVNTGSTSITALQVRSGNLGAFKWGGTALASVAQPAANTWHHVIYTFDGTTHKLYLNGILRNSTATAANTAAVAAAYIGDYTAGGGERWPGLIDDVRVYNYDLTEAQAKTLYNDGVARYGPVTGVP